MLALIPFPLLYLSAYQLCVSKWLAEPQHRTLPARPLLPYGLGQPCPAGERLQEHSCRRLGGKGSEAACSLRACSAPRCYRQPCTSQHFHTWHWHLSGATLYLMALKETDSWQKTDWKGSQPRCTVLKDTACFCAEDCKRSKPLKFSRILHFVC